MIFIKRYKTYISAVVLAVQISILGISTLHSHIHHSHSTNGISFSSSSDSDKVTDPFIDETGRCKIFEFIQSVSNTLISDLHYFTTPVNTKIVLHQNSQDFFSSSLKFVYGLRAPPVL